MEHDFDTANGKCRNCLRPKHFCEKFALACKEADCQLTGLPADEARKAHALQREVAEKHEARQGAARAAARS